jgi:hypothetical protein
MPHDREVGGRHRARQIINAAAADLQNFRLLGDRPIVSTVDHRFALSNPALVSAPSKKSTSLISSGDICFFVENVDVARSKPNGPRKSD